MRTYSCSGTLGDTYINLCILYNIATKEVIECKHYTLMLQWHSLIKQIYSLLPNIHVEFVSERAMSYPRIHSAFSHQEKYGDEFARPEEWCVFPQFAFPKLSQLPNDYVVLNPQSGRPDQGRILTKKIIEGVIENSKYPIVILGTDRVSRQIQGGNVINLVGKTSLLEAMGTISRSKSATTFQGVMSVVAASHRVPSDVYVRGVDVSNLAERIPLEWMPYHKIQEKKL